MQTKPRHVSFGQRLRQVRQHHSSQRNPSLASAGFVLTDSSLRPIYLNDEAVQILSYPRAEGERRLKEFLLARIPSLFASAAADSGDPVVDHIESGRRRYVCRFFAVAPFSGETAKPSVAILIERASPPPDITRIADEFGLTQREQEAVQLLVQGLTSKEIATRMGISPNTVKAFLRLAMVKTGVTTRAGIVGKVLRSRS